MVNVKDYKYIQNIKSFFIVSYKTKETSTYKVFADVKVYPAAKAFAK